MKRKYHRRARHAAGLAAIWFLGAVGFAAFSSGLRFEHPSGAFAAALAALFSLFAFTAQTKEAARCLTIARKWDHEPQSFPQP